MEEIMRRNEDILWRLESVAKPIFTTWTDHMLYCYYTQFNSFYEIINVAMIIVSSRKLTIVCVYLLIYWEQRVLIIPCRIAI